MSVRCQVRIFNNHEPDLKTYCHVSIDLISFPADDSVHMWGGDAAGFRKAKVIWPLGQGIGVLRVSGI